MRIPGKKYYPVPYLYICRNRQADLRKSLRGFARLLVVFAGLSSGISYSQSTDITRRVLHLKNTEWEFSTGLILINTRIGYYPGMESGVYLKPRPAEGFQLSAMPVYRFNDSFGLRTGISLEVRNHRYLQAQPWEAGYREKMTLAGIPLHIIATFGYPDLRFRFFSGFRLNIPLGTELDYSVLSVPGFRQEGNENISFDRIRFLPDFQIGGGVKLKTGAYFLGVNVSWFIGLRSAGRFDPARIIYLYNDLEPVIEFYSPAYRSQGFMLNLTIQKWKKRT